MTLIDVPSTMCRNLVLEGWNQTDLKVDDSLCYHDLVMNSVKQFPQKLCLVDPVPNSHDEDEIIGCSSGAWSRPDIYHVGGTDSPTCPHVAFSRPENRRQSGGRHGPFLVLPGKESSCIPNQRNRLHTSVLCAQAVA